MHATIEQLICIRDSEPLDAGVAAHVQSCQPCLEHLEELRLRQQQLKELPQQQGSADNFAKIQERLTVSSSVRYRYALTAAAVVAALLIGVWVNVSRDLNTVEQIVESGPMLIEQDVQDLQNGISTQELIRRSQTLESVYSRLSQVAADNPTGSTQQALDALENRLAVLDYGLNQRQLSAAEQQELNQLWRRRVDTLQSMVGVQQAELAMQGYHGFQVMPASYSEYENTW